VLSRDPVNEIEDFMRNAPRWARPRIVLELSPSDVIAEDLGQGTEERLWRSPPARAT
jgi:hypothetical protein